MITLKGNSAIYECVSTDSKPTTGIDVNTLLHELDTDKWYYFKANNTWGEVPNTGGGGSSFEPTQSQLDAMNSGITAEDVQQIGTNESNISSINTEINSASLQWIDNALIKTGLNVGDVVNTTPTSSETWSCCIADCEYGQKIKVTGEGGGNPRLWAFIDADDKLITCSSVGLIGNNLIITAPANTKKVILNSTITGQGDIFRSGVNAPNNGIFSTTDNSIYMANGIYLYISATEPTGNIENGSIGIGWDNSGKVLIYNNGAWS